ncbi:MAG: choice-of-anchor D domain-containing protein [Ignavibacteriae bacterium]|nr:choice-of-anchor D domain-containing protein [Ignavibacteriota bacterium]
MKKILLACAGVLCFVLQLHAQGFYSIHSPNGLDVWAVGASGNVFRSFDGGATWSQRVEGSSTLRSVFTLGTNVWMVGDNGQYFRSIDGGGSFVASSPAGTSDLTAIAFADVQTGWLAGTSGLMMKTTDGGSSWTPLTTGTAQKITAMCFVNAQTGYAGGNAGALLKTNDGGTSWTVISQPTWTKRITSVAAFGSSLYVTGADAFCAKSINAGGSWSLLNFNTDSQSDVNGAFAKSESEAIFVGGGGYIRRTQNGGGSYEWPKHGLHATLTSIYFADAQKGWACSEKTNAILRTTDGGATWQLPTGTTMTAQWTQKLSVTATVRGNAFSISPLNKNIIYCGLGNRVFVSYDRGETWAQTATLPTGTKVNSFYVSPKDTNLWVAAYGTPDRIIRSTDRGVTWTATITRDFSEYGMPLEMDGSHPDTLYFGPEDGKLYQSKDFGLTWTEISNPAFRSPCDIVVVRDNPDVIWVGDGVTGSGQGQMFRSRDGGRTFQLAYTVTGSEIPTAVGSSVDNSVGYATAWGSGGVMKTADMGQLWNSVATTSSTWGVDIAKDDPNVVMFGVYGGGTSYLSSTAGVQFSSSTLSGSNYAIFAYDRGTFLAQQSGGVFKYYFTYTVPTTSQQTLALTSPNGGENWSYGTPRAISWSSTNISSMKIEYKTSSAAAWQTIVASTPGSVGSYTWTVPNTPTTQARVRISDANDSNPVDSSDNVFAITVAALGLSTNNINFGSVIVGQTSRQTITLTNSGTGVLVVSNISSSDPSFVAGRNSFTIPSGGSDTLSIQFAPLAVQPYSGQMQISCNVPGSPVSITASGSGLSSSTLAVTSPNGGENWTANTMHPITWNATGVARLELSYRTSATDAWRRIAQSVDAALGSFSWSVPNTPTTHARVRVVDRASGAVVDSSDADFTITGTTSVAEGRIPTTYELSQNYPNPFNPTTAIRFSIPVWTGHAPSILKVHDVMGREVATLVNEEKQPGTYDITFDASNLASGVYFYRLTSGSWSEMKRMILLK